MHTYVHTYIHTYVRTDRRTDRQTDGRTDRRADRQTDRDTGRQSGRQAGSQAGSQAGMHTYIIHTHVRLCARANQSILCAKAQTELFCATQACLFLRGKELSAFILCSSRSSLGVHANTFHHILRGASEKGFSFSPAFSGAVLRDAT